MAFGTGLHPTTRLCLAALESLADDGRVAGARVLDVGCGSGILAIAAVKLGASDALGVDTDPIAIEATLGERPAEPSGPADRARGTAACRAGEPPFDVVLANLIAGVLVPLAGALRDELRPGGTLLASGIFIDREAEVRAAFEAAGLERRRRGPPRATGSRSRPTGRPDGPAGARLRSSRCPPSCSRSCSSTHIALAIGLFLPSILLPFALRARRATVESESRVVRASCGRRRTARSSIGAGLAITGLGLVAVLGPEMLQQPWLLVALDHLLREPRASPSSSSARTCAGWSASRPRPTTRPGRSGRGGSATSPT